MSEIFRRFSIGSLAVLVGQGINTAGQILVVPLFLWAWGAELYGEWLVLYAVVAYISLLDFGMQSYVVNRLNQCYSVKDLNNYSRILHSALMLYLSIAVAAVCLMAVAIYVVPVAEWLNFKLIDQSTVALTTFLLATQLIFAIPQGLITGLYRTFQEFPRGAMLANLHQTSVFGLTALILIVGGNVLQLAVIRLIPLVAVIVFVLYDLRKRHPEIKIGISHSDWSLAITFLGPSLLFFLIQITNAFTIQGSIIVVSVFAGSAYVAVYAIHRTLTNIVRQIVGSLGNAIWPELTALEAHGDYSKLRMVHRAFVKMSFSVSVFIGIWLHFVGEEIIQLWTFGRIRFDQRLLDFFLLYLIFQALWLGSSYFPLAFNLHTKVARRYIFSAILGLGLAVVLVQYLGIVGVVLGLLIADILICGWFVPSHTCRIVGDNVKEFWFDTVVRGVPVIFIVWSTAWSLAQVEIIPILRILVIGGSLTTVGICLGYFLWLNEQERRKMQNVGSVLWNKYIRLNPREA